jgi:hypothetical protein
MRNVKLFVKPLRGIKVAVHFPVIQDLICYAEFVPGICISPNFAVGDQL